jgi:hypothetical protein
LAPRSDRVRPPIKAGKGKKITRRETPRAERHAAALALVGWYLMVPPVDSGGLNEAAPINRSRIAISFDTADACQQAENLAIQSFEKKVKGMSREIREFNLAAYMLARCIATDDPRLKEK